MQKELTDKEKDEIKLLLKRRSRFVWNDKMAENTLRLLQQIKDGVIKLEQMLPGGVMTYQDYLFERDLLKYVNETSESP